MSKLSKSALSKACSRHNWALQWCWNYEKMQAVGYAYAMVPVFKELYSSDEVICRNLERHMTFYNTHPGASALIFGADVALEEAGQGGTGDSLKIALMGPLAGIGDTIQTVLVTQPFNIVAASLAAEGNWLSILFSTLPVLVLFFLRWPLFRYGYKKGASVIDKVSNAGALDKIQTGASILGATVMGGFIPSMIDASLPVNLGNNLLNEAGEVIEKANTFQSVLDSILPCLVPIIITGLCYYGIKVKKAKPSKIIFILFIIAFVLGAYGCLV